MRTIALNSTLSCLLLFVVLVGKATHHETQAKVWLYDAADNSGALIKITEGEYGVADVYFWESENGTWKKLKIMSIDINQEYIKVKSTAGIVYELFIDWKDDKIILVDANKKEVAYWHR
jgi:hypothetical protein